MKKVCLAKRILAYTLTFSLFLSQMILTPALSASAEEPAVWDGTKAESFAGGSGTALSPYLIENGGQLYKMVADYSAVSGDDSELATPTYFKIINDIYLNNITDADMENPTTASLEAKGFKPWHTHYSQSTGFCGVVDGGGHTVYGLYSNVGTYSGLIPNAVDTVEIYNLNLKNSYVYATGAAGGIVGGAFGSVTTVSVKCCTVDKILVDGGASVRIAGIIGGLAGSVKKAAISNCAVTRATLKTSHKSYPNIQSALLGYTGEQIKGHTVTNCYTDGSAHPVTDTTDAAHFKKFTDYITYTNVYTAASNTNSAAGVTQLTEDQMKGEAAKEYMPGLNFDLIWQTAENDYPVIRENPIYVWDGTKSSVFSGGDGSKGSPYLISTPEQLAYVVSTDLTDGLYFKLISDIRINDTSKENWKDTARNWVWADVRFVGTFDGNGHTIDGLYYKGNQFKRGLFSYIGDTVIKNLIFTNASINTTYSGDGGSGILVGQLSAPATMQNIYVDESCELNVPNGNGVAAIASWGGFKATIDNCAVLTDKIVGKSYVGAVIGTNWSNQSSITNCFTSSSLPIRGYGSIIGSANNYALVADDIGTVVLDSAEHMKGENAKLYMPGLDFEDVWEITDGYPILSSKIAEIWDGTKAESFAGGEGTEAEPYLIENGGQLYKMVADYSNTPVLDKPESHTYFKLTKDINLGYNQWYTVESTAYPNNSNYTTGFGGIIYGDGYTVKGLYNGKAAGVAGLIPVTAQGAEIHDLHLKNGYLPKVDWNSYAAGALVGLAAGNANSTPITVEGCSVRNFTAGSRDASSAFVGFSYSQSVKIENCYCADSDISHTGSAGRENSGAFIAYTNGSAYGNSITIENSYCAGISPTVSYGDGFEEITSYKNVYTDFADYENTVEGLTKLDVAQMQGAAAKDNLQGFNFNQIWQCGEEGEYPYLRTFEDRAEYWDGTAAESFAGGTGSKESPFEISNAQQLYLLASSDTESTHGKYYKLTGDIDISGVHEGWQKENPYVWAKKTAYLDGYGYGNSFAGVLDGAGHTVSGIYYSDDAADGSAYAYGLIPLVSADAVIKNITVKNVKSTVTGSAYVGAVAGAAHVSETDIANPLKMVQFVGVKAQECDITAENAGDILGGASRGVKFELCAANKLIGSGEEKISVRNCNSDLAYNDDVIIYNSLNADGTALVNIKKYLLETIDNYITDINGDSAFDIRDLISAKKCLAMAPADEALVWSQEFNENALDYSVWTKHSSMSTGSTLKYSDTAAVNGGSLTLTCTDTGTSDANGDKIYGISYGLSTIDSMSFKYGRLEMRAKLPFDAGAFPSFWLSSRNAMGYDPFCEYSTEIDVFELFGKEKTNTNLIACIHKWYNENGVKTGKECSSGTGILAGNTAKVPEDARTYKVTGSAQKEFHTFVFDWDENTMKFSVDGNVYYTAERSKLQKGFDISGKSTDISGVFDQFLYVRLNNHMYSTGDGAAYTYTGNASDIDASKLNYEIDYIRLYQKNDGKSKIYLK